jgi:anti-anti-sigma factor
LLGLEAKAYTADIDKALEFVARDGTRNAVVDCQDIVHVDSTGMAFFVQVWRQVTEHGGRLAFCNLPEQGQMRIEWCSLDKLWTVYPSRVEALRAVEISRH